jgi:hypothetical protein
MGLVAFEPFRQHPRPVEPIGLETFAEKGGLGHDAAKIDRLLSLVKFFRLG